MRCIILALLIINCKPKIVKADNRYMFYQFGDWFAKDCKNAIEVTYQKACIVAIEKHKKYDKQYKSKLEGLDK